jgi:hypothetical protein
MTDSVSRATIPDSKPDMNAIGYIMAACLLLLLLPALPLIALIAACLYLLERMRRDTNSRE